MKKILDKYFVPSSDTHFEWWFEKSGQGYYQNDVMVAALKLDKRRGGFIDIGAHVGFWSIMADVSGYQNIYAFEPIMENLKCYLLNSLQIDSKFWIFPLMVGNGKRYTMNKPTVFNSGSWEAVENEKGVVSIKIDSIIEKFEDISLIKIDVHGMEAEVIKGMEATLRKFKPIVIVEKSEDQEGIRFLEAIGFVELDCVRRDGIFGWVGN